MQITYHDNGIPNRFTDGEKMAVLYTQGPYSTGGPANVNTPAAVSVGGGSGIVIDGTPVRVAMLAIAAAVGIAALRWAGFKFNVGV